MESKVNSFKINNIYDDDSNLNSLNKSVIETNFN